MRTDLGHGAFQESDAARNQLVHYSSKRNATTAISFRDRTARNVIGISYRHSAARRTVAASVAMKSISLCARAYLDFKRPSEHFYAAGCILRGREERVMSYRSDPTH